MFFVFGNLFGAYKDLHDIRIYRSFLMLILYTIYSMSGRKRPHLVWLVMSYCILFLWLFLNTKFLTRFLKTFKKIVLKNMVPNFDKKMLS